MLHPANDELYRPQELKPYYAAANTLGQQGHCGLYMSDRANSESLVVGAGETAHDVLGDAGAAAEIIEFLLGFRR